MQPLKREKTKINTSQFENNNITPDPEGSAIEQLARDYLEAKADQEELEKVLRPILALAISRLPQKQLKVSLADQAKLGELDLQMKVESKSGAVWFRAVKVQEVPQ